MIPSERDKLTRDMLKQYQQLRAIVATYDDDAVASQFAQANANGRVRGGISNPTVRGAEILLRADRTREWVEAIDCAMAELGRYYPDVAEIVTKHFRMDRSRGYIRKYAKHTQGTICEIRHISIATYYNMLDQGVDIVRFHAAERGLFRKTLFL